MASNTTRTKRGQQDQADGDDMGYPVEGQPGYAAGQEVEAVPVGGGMLDHPSLQSLMDWCVSRAERTDEDDFAVMAAEVARILAGEDATQVLSESKPLQGKNYLDKPFILHGFTLTATDFEEGWPFYANMDAERPTIGGRMVINCGGPKVIATLKRLDEIGEYPYAVKLVGAETKRGFTVLDLVAAHQM